MPLLFYQRDLGILAADCIQSVLSEECKQQIESMSIADQLGLDLKQPISLWKIILLLIPLIGLTFVYFEKFHPTKDTPKKQEGTPSPNPVEKKQSQPVEKVPSKPVKEKSSFEKLSEQQAKQEENSSTKE